MFNSKYKTGNLKEALDISDEVYALATKVLIENLFHREHSTEYVLALKI